MADTTTLAKAFIKPEIGSHPDTWGDVLNGDIDLIDSCVGGVAAFTVGGNFTISAAQAQNLTYEISGALSADATITFPVYRGFAFVRNLTTGGHQLVCRMNTGGASISVGPGIDRLIVGDGVDFFSNVLSVPLSGGTMTGPLVINTAAGTTGLNVSANVAIGGVVGVGGNIDAPTFSSHGIAALTGAALNSAYTNVYDNSGAPALVLGGTNDPTNYYRQSGHYIQAHGGTGNFASFTAGGVALYGTTSINNSGANGSLTINGTGTALNVPNGSTNLSSLNVVNGATADSLNVANTSALHAITGTSLNLTGNVALSNYIFFAGGGGAVNTTGGPLFYADASNTVIKIGSGNGSILVQNFAGTNVAGIGATGAISGSSISGSSISSTGGISATGNISSSAQLSGNTVVTNGLTVNGQSNHNGNSACTGQVQGNQIYGSGSGYGVYAGDSIYAANRIEADGNEINAIYAPNGGIYTNNNLYCSGSGVTYNNIGNHGFNFRWDGATIFARVDNAVEIPIANANNLGAYLPLSGGTITGALNVNDHINAFNGLSVNNTVNVNSGGLNVQGGLSVINGGGNIHGGLTCDGAVVNGGCNITGPVNFYAGGTALNVPNGDISAAGAIYSNRFMQASQSGTAFYAPNGNLVCQNIQAANDSCAGGVFRRYILGTGPRGARVECYGGDWDAMTFVMNQGYLQISPDSGASGYSLLPVSGFSDARLKENIRDAEIDALAALCDLTLRTFEWNEKATELMPWRSGTVPCGLVAQELQATIPYAVSELPSSDMLHVHNDYLVPYLIRAIQQLTERVEELEAA
jgi:hypothetical protein